MQNGLPRRSSCLLGCPLLLSRARGSRRPAPLQGRGLSAADRSDRAKRKKEIAAVAAASGPRGHAQVQGVVRAEGRVVEANAGRGQGGGEVPRHGVRLGLEGLDLQVVEDEAGQLPLRQSAPPFGPVALLLWRLPGRAGREPVLPSGPRAAPPRRVVARGQRRPVLLVLVVLERPLARLRLGLAPEVLLDVLRQPHRGRLPHQELADAVGEELAALLLLHRLEDRVDFLELQVQQAVLQHAQDRHGDGEDPRQAAADDDVPEHQHRGQREALDEQRQEPLVQIQRKGDALPEEVLPQLGQLLRHQPVAGLHVRPQQGHVLPVEAGQPVVVHQPHEDPEGLALAAGDEEEQPRDEVHALTVAHGGAVVRVGVEHAAERLLARLAELWELGEGPADVQGDQRAPLAVPAQLVVLLHRPAPVVPAGVLPDLPPQSRGHAAVEPPLERHWVVAHEHRDANREHLLPLADLHVPVGTPRPGRPRPLLLQVFPLGVRCGQGGGRVVRRRQGGGAVQRAEDAQRYSEVEPVVDQRSARAREVRDPIRQGARAEAPAQLVREMAAVPAEQVVLRAGPGPGHLLDQRLYLAWRQGGLAHLHGLSVGVDVAALGRAAEDAAVALVGEAVAPLLPVHLHAGVESSGAEGAEDAIDVAHQGVPHHVVDVEGDLRLRWAAVAVPPTRPGWCGSTDSPRHWSSSWRPERKTV
mmetsp:Transcript_28195/g.80430  ORF Transcript_28195/g.80430 Transcript_28195/m.80430 type:complete len:698 (+) Transcript_28195:248-2341(+)